MDDFKAIRRALLAGAAALACTYVLADDAEIVSLAGKGEYRIDTSSAWREAKLKQRLTAGQFVRTGDLSSMALLFADKTQLRLAQNSMFQLKGEVAGTNTIQLRQGRSWTQTKDRGTAFRMETPSAMAAIHGTDWEMEVAEDGTSRITVLHGTVEFFNDQGWVIVRDNEQAVAEPGKAPVKRILQSPAERMQWVTAYSIDLRRYPELRPFGGAKSVASTASAIAGLLESRRFEEARARAQTWTKSPESSAAAWLLLADFAIMAGDWGEAEKLLRQGQSLHSRDARFAAQLARLALLRGESPKARELAVTALDADPESLELKLVLGEIARYTGEETIASASYREAAHLAPGDARPWQGLGEIESEKEDVKRARQLLTKALALDPGSTVIRGELATLETFSNNFGPARRHYEQALEAQADDYVALTGLGVLQLKRGETESALRSLLQASVIEPRYARAVIFTAIAYYQLGRHQVALDTLARASELDPNDPLPYQLKSLILTDRVEYGSAVDAARAAMQRMPFLKSLNQIANDQKGAANLGNALAQFGLEDWALNYAQNSYNPFWAGSHLFLADRYTGRFSKESELMQGYLTDPTVFGASPGFQTLIPRPGNYFSTAVTSEWGGDIATTTPRVVANGYANEGFPAAYFVEGLRLNAVPNHQHYDAYSGSLTLGLGALPREDLGVFLYASSTNIEAYDRGNVDGATQTSGIDQRLEAGINYKFDPTKQSWLKGGIRREHADIFRPFEPGRSPMERDASIDYRTHHLQARHSVRVGDTLWNMGAEWSRQKGERNDRMSSRKSSQLDNDRDVNQSVLWYVGAEAQLGPRWLVDAEFHYQRHTLIPSYEGLLTNPTVTLPLYANKPSYARSGVFPRLGVNWSREPGETLRLAYQKWLRPIATSGLAPVATAGIVLDDKTVLPGGVLERVRLQFDREWTANTYLSAFVETKSIRNLGQPGAVLNTYTQVADLDRLRNRAAKTFQFLQDTYDKQPVFLRGNIKAGGVALNQRLSDRLSAYFSYVHSDTENTSRGFAGSELPNIPRHLGIVGGTWIGPQRWVIQTAAIWRSSRFSEEGRRFALPASWDLAIKAGWQSADKRWLLEFYGSNLLKKDSSPLIGANVVWRY